MASDPIAATRVNLVPAAVQPPVPVNDESTQTVQQIQQGLQAAAGNAAALKGIINGQLAALLGQGTSACMQAKAAITSAIETALSQAYDVCQGSQFCVEQHVAALTQQAWEMAAQVGCRPMPSFAATLPSDFVPPTGIVPTPSGSGSGSSGSGGGSGSGSNQGTSYFTGLKPPPGPIGPPIPIPPPPGGGGFACPYDASGPYGIYAAQMCAMEAVKAQMAAAPNPAAWQALCQQFSALGVGLANTLVADATAALAAGTAANASIPVVGVPTAQAAWQAAFNAYHTATTAAQWLDNENPQECLPFNAHIVIAPTPPPCGAGNQCWQQIPGPFPPFAGPPPPPPPPPTPTTTVTVTAACAPTPTGTCSTDNTPITFTPGGIPSADYQATIDFASVSPGGIVPPTCSTCGQPKPCGCKKACPPDRPRNKQWCVYQDADGNCYVVSPGQEPNTPTDKLQGCAADPGKLQPIVDACRNKNNPPIPLPPGAINAPNGGAFCTLDPAAWAAAAEYVSGTQSGTEYALAQQGMAGLISPWQLATDQSGKVSIFAKPLVYALTLVGAFAMRLMGVLMSGILDASSCQNPASMMLKFYRVIMGFAERWLSTAFGDLTISARYLDNYLCPRGIPTTADAQAAYLANAIDETLRDTWTAANGDCPEPALTVLEARRSKQSVGEIVSLFRRGVIGQAEYQDRIRALGFIEGYEADDFIQLSNYVPGPGDLIRMMQRDVEDQGIVTKFELDKDFDKKWQGKVKQWGNWQGVSDEVADRYWRAHWSIPSPSQLYEMYQRFRKLDPADPLYVDEQTVKTALEQQDILPYWVPKLLAMSFRLVTRSDLIQMIRYGAVDEDTLKSKLSQLGYSDEDASVYATYLRRRVALTGRTHRYTLQYIQSAIDSDTLKNRLLADHYMPEAIQDIVAYADGLRKARLRSRCLLSIKKQYFLGEYDYTGLLNAIQVQGLDPIESADLAETWQCEKSSRIKQVAANTLCKWLANGAITPDDMASRLTNIGYAPNDVVTILQQCQYSISQKKAAALAKQAAEAAKAEVKAEKEAQQAAKQAAQQQQQAAKQVTAMQRAAQNRQKAMIKAAEKWSRGCGGSVADNMIQITNAVAWVRTNTPLTYDEAIAAVTEAATLMDGKASCDWLNVYQGVAAAWATARQDSPGPEDIGGVNQPAAGNGQPQR